VINFPGHLAGGYTINLLLPPNNVIVGNPQATKQSRGITPPGLRIDTPSGAADLFLKSEALFPEKLYTDTCYFRII